MKLLVASTALGLSVALAGCGVEGKKAKKKAEKTIELYGEWEQDCQNGDFVGFSHYRDQLKFNPTNSFEQKTRLFGNSCDKSAGLGELIVSGEFEILEKSKKVDGAYDVNYTVKEAKLKPGEDTLVTALNTANYCGFSDWVKGEAKDILGKDCLGANYKTGDVFFDIVKRDGDSVITGVAPTWLKGKATNTRPTELNTNAAYKKNPN